VSEPFQHKNLQIKRELLNLARKYDSKASKETDGELILAYKLASALLFMNHADYLAQYIALSIRQLADDSIDTYFHGSISVTKELHKDMTIGESQKLLQKYEFSSKKELIDILGHIKSSRNQVAHTILKTDPSEIDKIDKALADLIDYTEKLIVLIDKIQLGMPPKNLMDIVDGLKQND
jgi:hypothetical protein